MLCGAVRCCAVLCRAMRCFLFLTYQISYERTMYQGMYVGRVTPKPHPAQLSSAISAAQHSAVRCRAVRCCDALCCVALYFHTHQESTRYTHVRTYMLTVGQNEHILWLSASSISPQLHGCSMHSLVGSQIYNVKRNFHFEFLVLRLSLSLSPPILFKVK